MDPHLLVSFMCATEKTAEKETAETTETDLTATPKVCMQHAEEGGGRDGGRDGGTVGRSMCCASLCWFAVCF
jgi:hypothetical protein